MYMYICNATATFYIHMNNNQKKSLKKITKLLNKIQYKNYVQEENTVLMSFY